MEIDGRVADNTLQQNFVLRASLALSTIVRCSICSRVGLCNRLRGRRGCFLARLPAQPTLSRTRNVGGPPT